MKFFVMGISLLISSSVYSMFFDLPDIASISGPLDNDDLVMNLPVRTPLSIYVVPSQPATLQFTQDYLVFSVPQELYPASIQGFSQSESNKYELLKSYILTVTITALQVRLQLWQTPTSQLSYNNMLPFTVGRFRNVQSQNDEDFDSQFFSSATDLLELPE